ncbi:MFS transporter [Roseomonas sp. HJA6]|uniref:MFS transporter n=1 Tax=Roseomonas alba TaxID=2846776 RepID=A0ABS7A7I2_9PROT|nr:MFS transporter [Neoroseomonas alba]MBW6398234.1 MFS transporter [Neoroseomonas alba]
MSLPEDGTARILARLVRNLSLIAIAVLLGTVVAVSFAALGAFEREVRPALEREATVIGTVVANPFERALGLGIPFDALVGAEEYLDGVATSQPAVAYLVLTDLDGRILAASGPAAATFRTQREVSGVTEATLPVAAPGGRPQGWLLVGVSRAAVDGIVEDTRWDLLIVLLVGVMVAMELLRYALDRSVIGPLSMIDRMARRLAAGDCSVLADPGAADEAGRVALALNALLRRLADRCAQLEWLATEAAAVGARAAREAAALIAGLRERLRLREGGAVAEPAQPSASAARLPLFLFVVAEQLSTSFIPLFGRDLARHGPAFASPDLLAALPIATFVAAVALATPWGGTVTARRGPRAAVLIGGAVAGLGYLGAALAQDLPQFALARVFCGIGYAVLTIACQTQMAVAAQQGRLARTLGGFTGTVMTGAVCGTAIGAVIADRLGYAATFLASVALVVVVMGLALRAIPRGMTDPKAAGQGVVAGARAAFGNARFTALLLLAAIPAKVVLAGFIFYLAPIALRDAGLSQAAVGRNVMLYGLCMLPAIALGGWLTDRARIGDGLIWGAAVLNGAAMLAIPLLREDVSLPIAIGLTGVAQGLASAPMLAEVAAGAGGSTALLLSFLRLGERVGSVVGPFAAAWLLARSDVGSAVAVLGAATALAGLGYALAARGRRRQEAAA